MVRYLSRLSSSNGPIQAVFSPITPYVPPKIGSLETFRESYRWFGTETVASVAQKLGDFPLGSLGYVYKLPDVTLDQVGTSKNQLFSRVLRQISAHACWRCGRRLCRWHSAALQAAFGLP